jgi:hypothetical protein
MSEDTQTANSPEPTQTTPNETSSPISTTETTQTGEPNSTTQTSDQQAAEPITVEALTLPDDMDVPQDRLEAAVTFANEHNIPADAVNAFLAMNADWAKADAEAAAEAAGPSMQETIETWQEETRNLPEIGGQNFEKTTASINRFLAEHTSGYGPEFDQMLALTGAGSHPLMIRFLHSVAEKYPAGEGKPAPGGAPAPAKQSVAKTLFPNQN